MMSVKELRAQFPQLGLRSHGERLVYLDSAASAFKPKQVIDRVHVHMEVEAANVHRGAHLLSDYATDAFEQVRSATARFLNAASASEIVFTPGTTGGINLLANSLGRSVLQEGDEILLSQMEHHSNIVPWQLIAQERKARVRFTPIQEDGSLDIGAFKSLVTAKTKIISLTQLSNALGTVNELSELIQLARARGIYFIVDAAQSVTAFPIDVQKLGCDFLVFSGHKLFGPTGVGVLYGREKMLNDLPPFLSGGSMISTVTEAESTFLASPHRFEAGTPAIAEVLGLGEAIRFVSELDSEEMRRHDQDLLKQAQTGLRSLGGVRIYAEHVERAHILSFNLEGAHASDVGAILNEQNVAVRAGHHCCQPLMTRLGVPGTVRASFSIYSCEEDVDRLLAGVKKAKGLLV
jgi:cysteine desulfurase/selenocysteine lyase